MAIKTGDYKTLIGEIIAAAGRDSLPQRTYENIEEELQSIEWRDAVFIVNGVSRLQKIPQNIYGLILERVEELKDRKRKEEYTRTSWQPKEACLSPVEFAVAFGCIGLMLKYHKCGLGKYDDLNAHFTEGFNKAMKQPGDHLEKFLRKFYQMLKSSLEMKLSEHKQLEAIS